MKKIAIFESSSNSDDSKRITASYRNAKVIAQHTGADLLNSDFTYEKAKRTKYDVLVLSTAGMYAPHEKIQAVVENNPQARKVVISNDYNVSFSIKGFRPFDFISGYRVRKKPKWVEEHIVVNLNLILGRQSEQLRTKKYDCIYYGACRDKRKVYFPEYLQAGIYLSTASRNLKKFIDLGCDPSFIKKLSWVKGKETLNLFRYNLYLEDTHSHKVFTNLSNRYYEAGFCDNVVFFDKNCLNTIRNSELAHFEEQVKEYMVDGYRELKEKIEWCNENFEKHLALQKIWRTQDIIHRKTVLDSIEQFLNKE